MSAEVVQLTGLVEPAPVPVESEHWPLPLESAPDVMSPETLSRVLDGVSVPTLAEWRTKDKHKPTDQMIGPPWRKFGSLVRYLKVDVVPWILRDSGSSAT